MVSFAGNANRRLTISSDSSRSSVTLFRDALRGSACQFLPAVLIKEPCLRKPHTSLEPLDLVQLRPEAAEQLLQVLIVVLEQSAAVSDQFRDLCLRRRIVHDGQLLTTLMVCKRNLG